MKDIGKKSLIIGALLTSTIILGVGATSKADAGKWDDEQEWQVKKIELKHWVNQSTFQFRGEEPFAHGGARTLLFRKRIK